MPWKAQKERPSHDRTQPVKMRHIEGMMQHMDTRASNQIEMTMDILMMVSVKSQRAGQMRSTAAVQIMAIEAKVTHPTPNKDICMSRTASTVNVEPHYMNWQSEKHMKKIS